MTTTVDPISGDELVGYVCAMITDQPWGEPMMSDEESHRGEPTEQRAPKT
jgi:hypothetical protein